MSRLQVLPATSAHPCRAVVLVDMPWTRDKDPRVPLGHASLLSSLAAAGVAARSVVAPINQPGFSVEAVLSRILTAARALRSGGQTHGLLIGIGAYVWCERAVSVLLPRLRTVLPQARVVVGGPQVTFAQEVRGLYPTADCVVRGAGEEVLPQLATAMPGTPLPGVVWREGHDHGSQARVALASIASPFLDGTIPVRAGSFLRWETKRGCAFKCSFCQHRNPESRDYQRLSVSRLHEEIELFAQRGVADIAVLDPIFNDGPRSHAILEECRRRGLTARLSLQARLEMTGADFMAAARGLDVRLEFGLQTIHRAEYMAVQRPNNMARVEENLGLVRRAGHPFEISLIYGLPNQTLDSFIDTVAWCLANGVPVIKAFPLMLLRGTALEQERDRWGLVENDAPIPQVVASHTFGPEEHARMAAISQALRATEGAHPSLPALLRRADTIGIDAGRFTPAA